MQIVRRLDPDDLARRYAQRGERNGIEHRIARNGDFRASRRDRHGIGAGKLFDARRARVEIGRAVDDKFIVFPAAASHRQIQGHPIGIARGGAFHVVLGLYGDVKVFPVVSDARLEDIVAV
ncbi:MAG: hypothetical protein ACLRSW_10335 [Christensenellaceae bacterium]